MAYKLTQQDIDAFGFMDAMPGDTATPQEMAAMNAARSQRVLTDADIETFQLEGAMPGEVATAADIAKMGAGYTLAMPVPPEATQGVSIPQAAVSPLRTITVGENPAMPRADVKPIAQDAMKALGVSDGRPMTYSEARAAGMDPADAAVASGQAMPAGAAAPAASAPSMPAGPVAAGMGGLLQQPISTDPFEGLSKRQRTILAFAAIADAGAALQGRQGTSFSDTLKGFNEIRDMNRKREAARQRNQVIAQLFGGGIGAAGGGLMSTTSVGPENAAEYKRQLFQAAAAGLIEPAMLKPMIDEVDARVAQAKQAEAETRAREEKTDFIKPIVDSTLEYLNPGGKVDEQGNPILSPDFQNMATRTGARLIGSNEYNQFVGNIDTIKSTYTFENMVDLKAQGVTFGALSESELAQVASLIGSLDPNNPLGTVRTLRRVNKMIDDANKRATGGDQGAPASGPLTYDPATGKWSDRN